MRNVQCDKITACECVYVLCDIAFWQTYYSIPICGAFKEFNYIWNWWFIPYMRMRFHIANAHIFRKFSGSLLCWWEYNCFHNSIDDNLWGWKFSALNIIKCSSRWFREWRACDRTIFFSLLLLLLPTSSFSFYSLNTHTNFHSQYRAEIGLECFHLEQNNRRK